MTPKEREIIIDYIKKNDSTYNYKAVDFKYYSDADLLKLKKRIDQEIEEKKKK